VLAERIGLGAQVPDHGVPEVPLTGRERFANPAEYLSLTSGR
jgi:hypothetical protein